MATAYTEKACRKRKMRDASRDKCRVRHLHLGGWDRLLNRLAHPLEFRFSKCGF